MGMCSKKWFALLALVSAFSVTGFAVQAQNVFTVTNTSDLGAGTLRQAIANANNTPNIDGVPDRIVFDLNEADQDCFNDGRCYWVFEPASGFPPINEGVIIDGSTAGVRNNGDNSPPPLLITGHNSSDLTNGFYLFAGDVTLNYLTVTGFGNANVRMVGNTISNITVEDLYIGADFAAFPFEVNNGNGIYIDAATDVTIRNNRISNGSNGIVVIRGGSHTIEGNEISDNTGNGIEIESSRHNRIGTPGNKNVIINNGRYGITIYEGMNGLPTGNIIQANDIGVRNNSAGNGNGLDGIHLFEADSTLVGGTEPNAGNTIVSNRRYGIFLQTVTGAVIQGNRIGTNNRQFAPNLSGELILRDGSKDNVIGGLTEESENEFGLNTFDDDVPIIALAPNVGLENDIQQNQFNGTREVRIDLNWDGRTPNDLGDADTGPNRLQNYPEIFQTRYNANTGDGSIEYRVDTDPGNAAYPLTIRFYNSVGNRVFATDTYEASEAGKHTVTVSSGDLPSGSYFVTFKAGSFQKTHAVVVIR